MSGYRVDAKVVLLGCQFCGKTSLAERYLHARFTGDDQPYQNTVGAAFGARRVEALSHPVVLGIWDTAGSERYEAMSRLYYRDAWAALLCYDVTSRDSWARVLFWADELRKNEPGARLYFVGTKQDLVVKDVHAKQVDLYMVMEMARAYGEPAAIVFETSSKTGHNVDALFDRIAADYVATRDMSATTDRRTSFQIEPPVKSNRSCNC